MVVFFRIEASPEGKIGVFHEDFEEDYIAFKKHFGDM